VLALLALLSSCGGGSGGAADNSWLSFSPASINITCFQGESPGFAVMATSSRTIQEVVNVSIVETTGAITTDVRVAQLGQLQYEAGMYVSPTLSLGTQSGVTQVRLCRDNPKVCASPYQGSPWQVP
jgi:hypothetical protein